MSRLVRLLSASAVLHPFGRLRDARKLRSCRDQSPPSAAIPAGLPKAVSTSRVGLTVASTPKRVVGSRAVAWNTKATVDSPTAVRVYNRRSGMTMVGSIDAVCRMIDQCIANEQHARQMHGRDVGQAA